MGKINFESKKDVIAYINAGLGSEGSDEITERVYNALWSENKISFQIGCEIPNDLWDYIYSHLLI